MTIDGVNDLISKILKRKGEFERAHLITPNFVMVNSKTYDWIVHHTLANMVDQTMFDKYMAGERIRVFKRNGFWFLKNDIYLDGDFQIGYIE